MKVLAKLPLHKTFLLLVAFLILKNLDGLQHYWTESPLEVDIRHLFGADLMEEHESELFSLQQTSCFQRINWQVAAVADCMRSELGFWKYSGLGLREMMVIHSIPKLI